MSRLIDADALKERFGIAKGCSKCEKKYDCYETDYRLVDFCDEIDYAPTVEAEPVRHGKWVFYRGEDDDEPYNECSNCHISINDDWFYSGYENGEWVKNNLFNYCPHCGAKMDGK